MKKLKEELKYSKKGITLISLVVTIIVLLILAGVTIATLTGDNGILTRAKEAKEKTEQATKDEKTELARTEDLINEYVNGIEVEQVTDENPGVLETEGSDIYIINSIEDLVFFAYDVTNGNTYEGKTVKLGLSLDFNSTKSYVDPLRTDYGEYGYNGELKTLLTSGAGFNMIGSTENDENGFYGIFEGNGYMIRNLFIDEFISEGTDYKFCGLFSKNYGTITNLDIMGNINITEYKNNTLIGLLTGINMATGIIDNCSSYGSIYVEEKCEDIAETYYIAIGGISGQQNSGIIRNCDNSAEIVLIGNQQKVFVGGIVGSNAGNILKSYNIGDINVNSKNENWTRTGGIAGNHNKNIEYCFNIGDIKGNIKTGAITGSSSGASIKNSMYSNKELDVSGAYDATINENNILDENLTIEKILDMLENT